MPLKHSDRHYAQIYSYFMHNLNSVRLSVFQDTQRVEQIESECLKRIEEGALPGHKIISSGDRGERSPSYFGISTLTLNLLSLSYLGVGVLIRQFHTWGLEGGYVSL